MSSTTRDKMIAGAADLLSRRGVHATSLRTVVQHTGTPRGSLGHHFPGGKQQLLEEAVRHAAESVAVPLETLMKERGAVEGLQAFVGWWRRILESSGFEAGCPVLAVAVEPMADEEDAASGSTFANSLARPSSAGKPSSPPRCDARAWPQAARSGWGRSPWLPSKARWRCAEPRAARGRSMMCSWS